MPKGSCALNVDRELLDARRPRIRIDDREALPDAGESAQRISGRYCESGRGTDSSGCWPAWSCRRWMRRRSWSRCNPADCTACRWRTAAPRTARSRRGWSVFGATCQARPMRGAELVEVRIAHVNAVAVDPGEFDHALGQNPSHIRRQRIHRLGIETDHHGVVLFLQAVLALPPHRPR